MREKKRIPVPVAVAVAVEVEPRTPESNALVILVRLNDGRRVDGAS